MSEVPEIDPSALHRPPTISEADFVIANGQERTQQHRKRVAVVAAAISVGATVQTPEECRDWLDVMRDDTTWGDNVRDAVGHQAVRDIFDRLSLVQEQSPEVSIGVEVAEYVNETKARKPSEVPYMRSGFVYSLLLVGLRQRGLKSSEAYRLLYHGDQMPPAETPLHRVLDDFLANHVELGTPPPLHVAANALLQPISHRSRAEFSAVAHLAATQTADSEAPPVREPSKLIQTATAATMNLFEYIDVQTGGNTNAATIIQEIKSRRLKTPYSRLEANGVAATTPFTAFIASANRYSPLLGTQYPALDEESIRDLPRALDRLLYIATNVGATAPKISADPQLRETIADVRSAIDEVVVAGVNRKLGAAPLSLQEVILALSTYMPETEIPAAAERLAAYEAQRRPVGEGAHRRPLRLLQQWRAQKLRMPGYGIIS